MNASVPVRCNSPRSNRGFLSRLVLGYRCTLLAAFLPLVVAGRIFAQGEPQGSKPPDERCGVYCLYTSLKALDVDVPEFAKFEQSLGPVPAGGFSLGALAAAAERYGAKTLGVSTTIANLVKRDQRLACIALIQGGHFVNVTGIDEEEVRMIDPSRQNAKFEMVPRDTWRTIWDGTALLIAREPLVPEEDLPREVSWTNLAGYAGLAVGAFFLLFIAARAIKKSGKGKMAI